MRWQFVDRIVSYDKWINIQGIKTVSLEEYHLLSRFGRKGFFPETLAVESCIEIARWLIMKSTDFSKTCIISEINNFCFNKSIGMGDIMMVSAERKGEHSQKVQFECLIKTAGKEIAKGQIEVELADLHDYQDPTLTATMWEELYAAS